MREELPAGRPNNAFDPFEEQADSQRPYGWSPRRLARSSGESPEHGAKTASPLSNDGLPAGRRDGEQ